LHQLQPKKKEGRRCRVACRGGVGKEEEEEEEEEGKEEEEEEEEARKRNERASGRGRERERERKKESCNRREGVRGALLLPLPVVKEEGLIGNVEREGSGGRQNSWSK
jgi:hypothetical protein